MHQQLLQMAEKSDPAGKPPDYTKKKWNPAKLWIGMEVLILFLITFLDSICHREAVVHIKGKETQWLVAVTEQFSCWNESVRTHDWKEDQTVSNS